MNSSRVPLGNSYAHVNRGRAFELKGDRAYLQCQNGRQRLPLLARVGDASDEKRNLGRHIEQFCDRNQLH